MLRNDQACKLILKLVPLLHLLKIIKSMEEAFHDRWGKKDFQFAIIQGLVVAAILHYCVMYIIPYAMKRYAGYMNSSAALSEVQDRKSLRTQSISSLEEEAERARLEIVECTRTVISCEPKKHLVSPSGKRFRIKTESHDANIPFHPTISERHENVLIGDKVDESKCDAPFVKKTHQRARPKNFIRDGEPLSTPPQSSQMHRNLAQQYPSQQHVGNDQVNEAERRATLSEQDCAYAESLRADETKRLLQLKKEAEVNRLMREYTKVKSEPDADEPGVITVVFKISDEVYATGTNTHSVSKHKDNTTSFRISRRFFLSEKVHSLFSFIFSHIYEFPNCEEAYLGVRGEALFTPELSHQRSKGAEGISRDFPPFDLICSYPKVVIHSAELFFGEGDDATQTIGEVGIKGNTLLTLRPTP